MKTGVNEQSDNVKRARLQFWRAENTDFKYPTYSEHSGEQKKLKYLWKWKQAIWMWQYHKSKVPLEVQKMTNSGKFNITIRVKYVLNRAFS